MEAGRSAKPGPRVAAIAVVIVLLAGCGAAESADDWWDADATIEAAEYEDRVHGAWVAAIVANHAGLAVEGKWLDEPGPGEAFELTLSPEFSTDDDTHVEWLDLHILETHGLDPSPSQIRDEWVDHLNGDIWVSTRKARELMDEGVLPPETGSAALNPDGAWSIDAQLETEVFGLIAPNRPDEARRRARTFAAVTNSGPAVDASAFYAHLYAVAFVESDVHRLIAAARSAEPGQSIVAPIVDQVIEWHERWPNDWRATREQIRDRYDDDPEFWGSRVNFAATIMALLYGDGDLGHTMDVAALAGWDADNNMTTAAGLLGVVIGFDDLPEPWASASDEYFNQDLTGDLPRYDSIESIADRTAALGKRIGRVSPS